MEEIPMIGVAMPRNYNYGVLSLINRPMLIFIMYRRDYLMENAVTNDARVALAYQETT